MKALPRFAIIGCGKIAPRHAAEAAKQGRLLAVCDIVKEKADALALAFSAKAYYSIHELLEKETETASRRSARYRAR